MSAILRAVKGGVKSVKNRVFSSPLERKVKECTNKEAGPADSALMLEIADATNNYTDYPVIMNLVWQRLELPATGLNYRKIYKTLLLLEYMVRNGSTNVLDDARSRNYAIKRLMSFQFTDEAHFDQGVNIREKAKALAEFIASDERVAEERELASKTRERFQGMGSNNWEGVGSGSDNYDRPEPRSSYRSSTRPMGSSGLGSSGFRSRTTPSTSTRDRTPPRDREPTSRTPTTTTTTSTASTRRPSGSSTVSGTARTSLFTPSTTASCTTTTTPSRPLPTPTRTSNPAPVVDDTPLVSFEITTPTPTPPRPTIPNPQPRTPQPVTPVRSDDFFNPRGTTSTAPLVTTPPPRPQPSVDFFNPRGPTPTATPSQDFNPRPTQPPQTEDFFNPRGTSRGPTPPVTTPINPAVEIFLAQQREQQLKEQTHQQIAQESEQGTVWGDANGLFDLSALNKPQQVKAEVKRGPAIAIRPQPQPNQFGGFGSF